MKVLTVQQPFAQFIVMGLKKLETRRWNHTFRGELAIHASRLYDPALAQVCMQEPFRSALRPMFKNFADMPRGKIIGLVTVTDCVRTDKLLSFDNPPPYFARELAVGDFSPGRYAFRFENPVLFTRAEQIPAKGNLGIWEFNEETVAA